MVRTVADEPHAVTFERHETDGQTHSPWVLRADIDHHDGTSHLAMTLHYGGGLFEPIVERLLRTEIDGARRRLAALVLTD